MKRLFIISAAALALMASCAKVEPVVTDQPLTFAVANYAQQTRAEAYSTDDTFGVYAYWTSENWETDGTTNSFMTNDKVFYSPEYAQGQWGTRAKYYWPRTGKLTFACYSPYTAQGNEKGYSGVPAFNKTDGFVISNYTIVDDTDVDLMAADLVADQTRNSGSAAAGQVSQTAAVPVLFHHLLTQVAFHFLTAENPNPGVDESEIIVGSVLVRNVASTGNYTQNADAPWSRQANPVNYEFNPVTQTPVGNQPAGLILLPSDSEAKPTAVPSRILLPQDLASVQADITFTIRTKYTSGWAEETLTSTVDLATALVPAWLPNMRVVYTITIDPISKDPITFDPAVAAWETPVEVPITIPE